MSKKHFDEALPSDCLDQLTEHAEGERQGKHSKHDRQKGRLLCREQRLTVCVGESDVLVAYKRDYLFYVMKQHSVVGLDLHTCALILWTI
jgi:hypothetical protein